jgi:hypothetical protein
VIYIPKIDKNIWPLYIPPLDDELFSSWFCRISNYNELRSQTLLSSYFPKSVQLWNRDIDMLSPKSIVDTLLENTPLSQERINKLFLKSYEGIAFEKANEKGLTSNILKLGIKHRKRKSYGLVFCPVCLKEDVAYFRKSWRLVTSIICLKCNCYLLEKCPNCFAPVSFHRNNINWLPNSTSACNPLNICECKYDLSNSPIDFVKSQLEIDYQNYIDETIKNGYNKYSQYSFLFIDALTILAYSIMRDNKKNKLFTYFKNEFNHDLKKNSRYFYNWDYLERKEGLLAAYYLLNDWPDRLKNISRKLEINKTDFYELPYFIEKQILFSR